MQMQLANYKGWLTFRNAMRNEVVYAAYKDNGTGAVPRTLTLYADTLDDLHSKITEETQA